MSRIYLQAGSLILAHPRIQKPNVSEREEAVYQGMVDDAATYKTEPLPSTQSRPSQALTLNVQAQYRERDAAKALAHARASSLPKPLQAMCNDLIEKGREVQGIRSS
jgi:hypothetical protein